MEISVIIPVWNRRELIQKAVDSVAMQSYPVAELVIVDDGSDDGTWEYIESLDSAEYPIVCKRIAHCGMPGRVRNVGIGLASCDWLSFLDSDDSWLPHKCMKQQQVLSDECTKFCHTREVWQTASRQLSQRKDADIKRGYVFEHMLKKCIIGPSTVLMHRSLVAAYGMFREDLEIAEDYEYWLRIAANEKISYIDMPCIVKYAGGQEQLSKKYDYIESFRIAALEGLVDSSCFSVEQGEMLLLELERKRKIWRRGAEKRGNFAVT